MAITQYRVTTVGGRTNMREEPDIASRVVCQLSPGVIVNLDPERTKDDGWLPVVIVRGWLHESVVTVLEPGKTK